MDAIPLLSLLTRARRALALNFPEPVWVKAELSQITERRGHRYLQLVQKGDAAGAAPVAKVDGVVWSRTFSKVVRERGVAARDVLAAGQEVCLRVLLDFHEVYGLKLELVDWDPSFTLGQLELRRQQIVAELSARGLLSQNGQLPLPPVPQRIAVLSSPTAAGYADFVAQLEHNASGYRVGLTLFDVSVQGTQVEPTVLGALAAINRRSGEFDAIALLRGGGSKLDLAGFDVLTVGEAIASAKLPVLVGVGHETDETLPDLVAHTSLKTPTALAEFLLARFEAYEAKQLELARSCTRWAAQSLGTLARQLERAGGAVEGAARRQLLSSDTQLTASERGVLQSARVAIASHAQRLESRTRELDALDPRAVFERGFSVATRGEEVIRFAEALHAGDVLTTHFATGTATSVVE